MDTPLAILLTFVVTAIFAWFLFRYEISRLRGVWDRRALERGQELRRYQRYSNLILATIDLGVLFYDGEGELAVSNRAAQTLLPQIPRDFHSFLDMYGGENQLRSNLMLGKEEANAILTFGGERIYLVVGTVQDHNKMTPCNMALLRNVTAEFEETKQRNEFVSNVSHELRTPLTTIRGYAESLVDWGVEEKKREQIQKDVQKIFDESVFMEDLINNLYLLSSVDEQSITRYMRVEALDMPKLARQLVEKMQTQAEEAKIELSFGVVSQIPKVYGDAGQLERVLVNLVSNAIKYGRENGKVQVYVGCITDEVYVKVKDDGRGISPEDQEHIFERFYRVEDSRSRMLGGRGLGLAIVKELVEINQGTISVSSALSHGSEFTIMLPSADKVLLQTLKELVKDGQASTKVNEMAAQDLEQLAQSMGLVAQWKSLTSSEITALQAKIARLTAGPVKRA